MNKTPQYLINTEENFQNYLLKEEKKLSENNEIDTDFKNWIIRFNEENNCQIQCIQDPIHTFVIHSCLYQMELAFKAGKENLNN